MALTTVLALEFILRLLPISDPAPLATKLDEPTFPHFEKNRDFVYSQGWIPEIYNRGRTNNFGFVNGKDYDPSDDRPLLAVIGDSFIEALMVPFGQSVTGRLQQAAGDRARVYSFALSGAPLSQYLLWAKNACQMFKPDGLYISVVGNDFDESFVEYKRARGGGTAAPFTYFAANQLDQLSYRTESHPSTPDHPTRMHELASRMGLGKLALTRHVRGNYPGIEKALAEGVNSIMSPNPATTDDGGGRPVRYVGNVEAKLPEQRYELSKLAVRFFFDELAKVPCFRPDTIIFSIDGMRRSIYEPSQERVSNASYFGRMRRYFLAQAKERGYEVVDLHEVFRNDYESHSRRFEYSTNGHWSGYGHQVVAEELQKRLPIRRIIAGSPAR